MGGVIHRWTVGSGGFIGEVTLLTVDETNYDLHLTRRKSVPLLELTDLYVHPLRRGRGWAQELLTTAVEWADAHQTDLVLRTAAYGPHKDRNKRPVPRMTKEELQVFYARFGFKSRKADPCIMVRRWR